MKKIIVIIPIVLLGFVAACSKESVTDVGSGSLYVPASSDTTANATLVELQEGRTLYINNCGACHSLYSPDLYPVSGWKSIISQMGPKTSMTSAQITLVTKYVCRGKQ